MSLSWALCDSLGPGFTRCFGRLAMLPDCLSVSLIHEVEPRKVSRESVHIPLFPVAHAVAVPQLCRLHVQAVPFRHLRQSIAQTGAGHQDVDLVRILPLS